jgi:hypothetical protein
MGALAEPIQIPYVEIMVRGLTIKGNFMYPPTAVGRLVDMIAACAYRPKLNTDSDSW